MTFKRTVIEFEDHFNDFYESLDEKVQMKFDRLIELMLEIKAPHSKQLKILVNTEGIYEVMVTHNNNEYRALGFFDGEDYGDLFVLLNGFAKKATKDYKQPIAKALSLRTAYYEHKKNEN